ncbi:hypothetical protein Peur_004634 [Populus x canadensis]
MTHVHFNSPGAFTDHSPGAFTDHSPAKVCLDQHVQGRRNFKFFNMWASHDQFLEVVSNHWSFVVYGTPIHISKCVLRLESELTDHQSLLQHDRNNQFLLEQDKLLRSKLLTLKFVEKQFFSQKIKCYFLKDSDRGSKFFHALMNHNHRRNFIPAIMTTLGCLSSSLEEVGAIFVNYLQQLLGTSKSTIPLASVCFCCGPKGVALGLPAMCYF